MRDNHLRDIFYNHQGNLIHKWDHYFDIYERLFQQYIGKKIYMLEIGISHGGSIQMWKQFFGKNLHVYAIDINPDCKRLEEENTTIFIGSQSDKQFLNEIIKDLPPLDIIIDDGGHTMIQQKVSFESLFLKLKEGGIYLVEDTHTSYWYEFEGGLKRSKTFIEYSKNFIDSLYENHLNDLSKLTLNQITRHINSICFFDSIIVFEKKLRAKPFHFKKGFETIQPYEQKELKKRPIFARLVRIIFKTNVNTYYANFRKI